jgi:putative transposase
MSKSRHTEAEMIGALKQLEAGRKAEDVAREVGVSKHTIYAWKAKYGGMDVSQAQEAKQLRDENTRLRKLVADLSLDKEALESVIRKNGWSLMRAVYSTRKLAGEHTITADLYGKFVYRPGEPRLKSPCGRQG